MRFKGKISDSEIAKREGVSSQVITRARRDRGIKPCWRPLNPSPRNRDKTGKFKKC